jgi:hypothetical protein
MYNRAESFKPLILDYQRLLQCTMLGVSLLVAYIKERIESRAAL